MKKLLMLLFAIVFCLSTFIGCFDSKNNSDMLPVDAADVEPINLIPDADLDVFSQFLDSENFVPGISQGNFIKQMERYRYNGISITNIIGGFHYDGENGGGYSAGGELFWFRNDYKAKDNEANYSNLLGTKVQLGGLELPYGIKFEDSLSDVFQKIGITVDPYDDFYADQDLHANMTLYRDNKVTLVFQNLKRAQPSGEYVMPYVLIYSETYTTNRADGRNVTVERTVMFSFVDEAGAEKDTDILGLVELSVCEKYKTK